MTRTPDPTGGDAAGITADLPVSGPDLPHIPAHAVVVCSGGLDSSVLAHWLAHLGSRLTVLAVDYGQRHRVELGFAGITADRLGAPSHVIDLSDVGRLLASALTNAQVQVPDGHYADDSMQVTVVPNRNAILLDLAVGLAVSTGAGTVAFGAHAGDHPIYPDCRPEFVDAYRSMVRVATEGLTPEPITVCAPFVRMTKTQIVALGTQLQVPFADTWSCYRGQSTHCGTCGTCTERREAFHHAGVPDPTRYAAGRDRVT
ncbi:7-cyano-7-deazaguanine synthase QueC [Salinispora cortesiana]|uniref:7-cyano-7-deazaguanine synthase QueC n=1 Tax=Salinispora cortesiana TaxID=1305843 RepID=UPI00041C0E5A|nr:7-cyano-7-deazaguanine synthase QueC [Salinispora cortesiana]